MLLARRLSLWMMVFSLAPSWAWGQNESVNTPGARELFLRTSSPSSSPQPLGLRYSMLRINESNVFQEADPDSVFATGDRIKLRVRANDAGYLYVAQRGSSGRWGVLFPSRQIDGGNNFIRKDEVYEVPAGGVFVFEQPPGAERMFIVLTRQPEPNLERLLYDLREGPTDGGKTLLADAGPINDSLVTLISASIRTRDLRFEKVSASDPGISEEAVYVVNVAGGPDSRLIVDLSLVHE